MNCEASRASGLPCDNPMYTYAVSPAMIRCLCARAVRVVTFDPVWSEWLQRRTMLLSGLMTTGFSFEHPRNIIANINATIDLKNRLLFIKTAFEFIIKQLRSG